MLNWIRTKNGEKEAFSEKKNELFEHGEFNIMDIM